MIASGSDYDSPWKEILEGYFPDFVEFYFEDIYREIDWKRGYEFLDKEFQKISEKGELGRRYVDKLVKVWEKSGGSRWFLIHIEVQGQTQERKFARRMFEYYCRIFDRFGRDVVSLAVLADDKPDWRPEQFTTGRLGCTIQFRFNSVKLLDYTQEWDRLEKSHNPFSGVTMAHLKALETRDAPYDRKAWKFQLIKHLYDRGYEREDIQNLFHFIDWVLTLPEELEKELHTEIHEFEQEKRMNYITSIEREAMEKGELQQAREDVLEALHVRFEEVPSYVEDAIQKIEDLDQLNRLHRKAIQVDSLEAFGEEV